MVPLQPNETLSFSVYAKIGDKSDSSLTPLQSDTSLMPSNFQSDSSPAPSDFQSISPPRLLNLHPQLYETLTELETFAELNRTGFRKILKKYDKNMKEEKLPVVMGHIDKDTKFGTVCRSVSSLCRLGPCRFCLESVSERRHEAGACVCARSVRF